MSSRLPEILAPAGDEEALRAAIAAGADAVYFGLSAWSARARAANFGDDALKEAIALLHRHGRKGYVAINTLVFDGELEAVERSIRRCAEAGVDAVIVQDLGVARMVRALAPDMPLHASTQMTCTDAEATSFAHDLGASRVILARELSLDDVAAIKAAAEVEVEVFVHGALCVAYSGQCLTSEAIGGRSANRGACAQACRLPYELVVDGVQQETKDRAYLLSPQDLEASALVPKLAALGVASLKIEGRLKGPAYVAATTSLYRAAVDALAGAAKPTTADRDRALATFSRGSGHGFLEGVDHQRLVDGRSCDHRGALLGVVEGLTREGGKTWLRIKLEGPRAIEAGFGVLVEGQRETVGELGGRVWLTRPSTGKGKGSVTEIWLGPDRQPTQELVGRRVFLSNDPTAEKEALAIAQRTPARLPLDLRLEAAPGNKAVLRGRLRDGTQATVESDEPLDTARSGAPNEEVLREKLARLGDTPFELGTLELAIEGAPLVPPALQNRMRRALVEALAAARPRAAHATTSVTAASLIEQAAAELGGAERANDVPAGLWVLCRNLEQARAAREAGADGVWLDILELAGTGAALRALREDGPGFVGVAPPRIRKPGEEKIDRFLLGLAPDGLLIRGLGALREADRSRGDGVLRVGDFSLNATNQLSVAELLRRGLAAFTPAYDLDAAQLLALVRTPLGRFAEVVVHQPMPLFHMEHCVFARELSQGHDHRDCGRPCERHAVSLRDRSGVDHPVIADVGCRNTVFHASSQSAASLMSALRAAEVRRFRVELVREDAAETRRVVRAYRELCDGKVAGSDVYARLRAESSYGVVRGSLRVL